MRRPGWEARGAGALCLFTVLAATPACRAREQGGLVVFAAASLRDAFGAMAADFSAAHPGMEVRFNFAGSQELRAQIEHGAPADVFAAADAEHAAALARAGLSGAPLGFARNELVLLVTPAAASTVRGLSELPRAGRVLLGAPEVPIGRYARQVLERAGRSLGADLAAQVEARVASRELNTRQILAKLRLGEADAGIVYRSDARAAPELVAIAIPAELNVVAEYYVAVVAGAQQEQLARAFVEHARAPAGQRALVAAGFLPWPEGQ